MNYLIYCIAFLVSSPSHVGHLAEYKYSLNDKNQIELRFLIEKEELTNFELDTDCNIKKMTAFCAAKYLKRQTAFKINGVPLKWNLKKSYTKDGHFILVLIADTKTTAIKNIKIENNCFYEFNSKFKNRVVININQFQKSFLLNKKRRSISLKK